MLSTDYGDGNPPEIEEDSSMSSLDDVLAQESCKKIKTEICKE